ncbi:hypothetical protein DL93DRAFT_2171766 [Clavulina sp. PMI_390]|nr:hypothetical protein DL93DRAFT_2171766 [Clavulina sp. PMI_390]
MEETSPEDYPSRAILGSMHSVCGTDELEMLREYTGIHPSKQVAKASVETKGRAALEKVTKDLEALKRIYKITLNHRRECLALLEQKLVEDPSFSTTAEYASLLQDYEKQHQSINLIENALEAGNRDYQKVVNLTVSELNSRVNHHQSIAVWAQEAAVRGNVGLMCYSFSLFIVALCLIITVQFFLVWCSRLGTAPIWNPNGCEVMLVLFSSLACLAVTGAIVLLVVTVYLLSFNVVPGSECQNGNAANWDAHLEFNVAPKQGAILGLSFLVATGASILILICLYIMAFGLRRFFWQRSEDAQVSVQLKLDDMV